MDKLIKAMALNNEVRIYLASNTDTINEAIRRHNLWPSSSSVLGKTLTMGQIMSSMNKMDTALTIKIQGNGQVGKVVVDGYSNGVTRGWVENPHVNFINNDGGLNDLYAIGNEGIIEVIKDLKLKDRFVSSTSLTGNLAEDFTYYFYKSEQTKSICSLGILIGTDNKAIISGGIVIQLLPNASEKTISFLEQNINKLKDFNKTLNKYSLEDILKLIFNDDYKILETKSLSFKCDCSKERFGKSLITLGKKDLDELIKKDKKIEARCHYCNNTYTFTKDDIDELFKR